MKKLIYKIAIITVLLQINIVSAADNKTVKNPLNIDDIQVLIAKFIDFIINLGIVAVVLYFIWTGFQFIAARGNPDAINKAKTSFYWTVVGTLVLVGAKVLVKVIENTLIGLN